MSSKSRNTISFTVSDFYCTCCGQKGIPAPRKASKQREKGHLKKMYCVRCKKLVNHIEIRQFDSYTVEDLMKDIKNNLYKEAVINE
jgi:hypothetical protein